MGLDMFLSRQIEQQSANNALFTITPTKLAPKELFDSTDTFSANNKTVSINVAYWRKANAIHNWIIQETTREDNCTPIELSSDLLRKLQSIIHDILHTKTYNLTEATALASTHLPPVSGFFFGDTEINEDYFEQLEYTDRILKKELKLADQLAQINSEFAISWVYEASW